MYLSKGPFLKQSNYQSQTVTVTSCAIMLTILQVHQASCPTKLDKRVERSRARMPSHQPLQVAPLQALQMLAGL